MANITYKKRKGKSRTYYITYRFKDMDGKIHQPWVRCTSEDEAQRMLPYVQRAEEEGREFFKAAYTYGAAQVPVITTVSEMVEAYFHIKWAEWQPSTRMGNMSLYKNYIKPFIGPQVISDITTTYIENYYADLLTRDAVPRAGQKQSGGKITARTKYDINKILRPAFGRMVRDGVIAINPCAALGIKEPKSPPREQWSAEEIVQVLSTAFKTHDMLMALFIAITFSATARTGEACGLTWDQVDVSPNAVENDSATIKFNKTLARVYRDCLSDDDPDIKFIFPSQKSGAKSVLVLKSLKTEYSERTVYIPPFVASLLAKHHKAQESEKDAMGSDYHDYNLVFAQPNGNPWEVKILEKKFKKFCLRNKLRAVDLYTLRHSGATIKMEGTRDIKALQADMGHASPEMAQKVYVTVTDDGRKKTAQVTQEMVFDKIDKDGPSQIKQKI